MLLLRIFHVLKLSSRKSCYLNKQSSNMRKFLFLLLLPLYGTLAAQPKQLSDRIKAVENNLIPYVPVKGFEGWNLLERMKHYNVPGVSIAIINNYKIDWAKGYGLADTTKKIPTTTETMFSAGSISKFLMAVTALKMVEEGKISLDSPINNYLTSWKIGENEYTKATPITLRMLLSHTAGTSQSSYFGFIPDQNPLPNVVDILNGAPSAESRAVVVNSEPNKEFRYSGGGSMIAQMALMDVSGQSFEALTQSVLFDPLRMPHSTFAQPLPAKYKQQAAWAYSAASWFKGMPYVYPQQAAAGLYSTPTDLAKFFIDVQKSYLGKGKVLGQNITRKMLTPQMNVSDGTYKEQIGMGPFILQRTDNKDTDGIFFEFTGVNAGFLAYGMASVTGGKGVVIMLNTGDDVNGLGKEIRRAVAKVYGWKNFLPEEVNPIALSDAALNEFTGRYRRSADEVVYIRKEKNYLVETINEGGDIYCFPISKDSIVFTDFNVRGGFRRDETGKVIALQTVWQQEPMQRMSEDEYSPSEYLKQKKYSEAKAAYKEMKMNESQITYLAYNLMNKRPSDFEAVRAILELAEEQHPTSSMVYSRWGDYYQKTGNLKKAIESYQKVLTLDPNDQQTKEVLDKLTK
jgi:CubicO group peptidase (beta-lactamase class C family)